MGIVLIMNSNKYNNGNNKSISISYNNKNKS